MNNKLNMDTAKGIYQSYRERVVASIDALEAVEVAPEIYRMPKKSARILFWTLFAFVTITIIWSVTSYLDEVAFGRGRVVPASNIQVVQNLEGGIIAELLVSTGDRVQKGDVLARLDATAFGASLEGKTLTLQGIQAREVRLLAEAGGVEPNFEGMDIDASFITNEQQSYQARIKALNSERSVLESQLIGRQNELRETQEYIKKIKASYESVKVEVEMLKPMVEQGISARVELIRLQRSAGELKGDVAITRKTEQRIQASIDEARNRIEAVAFNFQSQASEGLSLMRVEMAALRKELAADKDRVRRTEIIAPLSGIVKQMHVSTIGGVVRSGETFIELVPTDELLVIEARINPKDIGFIHIGQTAQVRLTAYDSSIYGAMEARVQRVGADSITEEQSGEVYYSVYVETLNQYMGTDAKKLPILPGMLADVSIITGKRTVMDYFLKPIRRIKERALREP